MSYATIPFIIFMLEFYQHLPIRSTGKGPGGSTPAAYECGFFRLLDPLENGILCPAVLGHILALIGIEDRAVAFKILEIIALDALGIDTDLAALSYDNVLSSEFAQSLGKVLSELLKIVLTIRAEIIVFPDDRNDLIVRAHRASPVDKICQEFFCLLILELDGFTVAVDFEIAESNSLDTALFQDTSVS